jgi:hypothetical protein
MFLSAGCSLWRLFSSLEVLHGDLTVIIYCYFWPKFYNFLKSKFFLSFGHQKSGSGSGCNKKSGSTFKKYGSIPELLKCLQIRALAHTLNHLPLPCFNESISQTDGFLSGQLDMTKCHGTDHWLLRHKVTKRTTPSLPLAQIKNIKNSDHGALIIGTAFIL